MREIKFRAWDKKKKTMILPSGAFGNQQHWSIESGNTQHWGMFQVSKMNKRICGSADDSGILMQYTGLLDKNGVEIYEGDIIYTSGYGNDIVVFKNGRFCIDGFEYPHNNINYNTAEVVGNIYENSDLLK